MRTKTTRALAVICAIGLVLAGCGSNENENNSTSGNDSGKLTDVKVVLDWTPNTNHTGLYAARDNGYFEEQGLKVDIIQPGDAGTDQMVATGSAEFGISVQENVTQARTQKVPIVSLAAIIQHNTSGFASPEGKAIKTPKDFEGKTYGGWNSPVEQAILESVMKDGGADFSKLTLADIGDSDYFTATKRNIDFAWIFYGWTGIEAEVRSEPLNLIYLKDLDPKLDYYTPVLITNEKMIAERKDIVQAFVTAAAQGYQFAIDHPEDAAELLIKAEPDLNADLVRQSQQWLSSRYQDDAPRWGEQRREVWANYAEWLETRKLMEPGFDVDQAFTNEFLPAAK